MAKVSFASRPVASALSGSDDFLINQSGVMKRASETVAFANLLPKTATFAFEQAYSSPASGTVIVVDNNRIMGTIVGADLRMEAGSCTASLQIADQDGSNAANITGLASLGVTTTVNEAAAAAANTMQITGTTDRKLLLVLSSVVGAGPLRLGVRYTRAS